MQRSELTVESNIYIYISKDWCERLLGTRGKANDGERFPSEVENDLDLEFEQGLEYRAGLSHQGSVYCAESVELASGRTGRPEN